MGGYRCRYVGGGGDIFLRNGSFGAWNHREEDRIKY